MNKKQREAYAKGIRAEEKKAKNIRIEKPDEIADPIIGLELWEFEVVTGEEAHCADEEIFMSFQGKEMRIYIDPEDGKLSVYTD